MFRTQGTNCKQACKILWPRSKKDAILHSIQYLISVKYVVCSKGKNNLNWCSLTGASRNKWWNKYTVNEHNMVKNHNWQEAAQLSTIYKRLCSGLLRTTPVSDQNRSWTHNLWNSSPSKLTTQSLCLLTRWSNQINLFYRAFQVWNALVKNLDQKSKVH